MIPLVAGVRTGRPAPQQRHLIGHEPKITGRRRENGEAGSVADRHDHQDTALHFHDGLDDRPTLETRTHPGSGWSAGSDGRELVARSCGNPAENARAARRMRQRPRERHRDPLHEVGDQPARSCVGRPGVLTRVLLAARFPGLCVAVACSLARYAVHAGFSSVLWLLGLRCGSTRLAYARWKLASLLRTSSAEREGPSLRSVGRRFADDPGTRLARGTRCGSPAMY